ncbi:hypothetical protein BJ170DRAFT_381277 [Xylariales sp. AK1849]|nr:hypothetical protein BJ170DRAFT_381277 [Xylariales sp. AK1849]
MTNTVLLGPQPGSAAPLSPWAARFGSHEAFESTDQKGHSGIAPSYPELDAVFYHAPLPGVIYNETPKNDELDALFHSERTQQLRLNGLKTRQIGALSEPLYPGMRGGHSLLMYTGTRRYEQVFSPDESRWFDCFKRKRWWDPAIPNSWKQHGPSPNIIRWTVDNDAIWKELSVALELANRILNLLLVERHAWLDALFFGLETVRPATKTTHIHFRSEDQRPHHSTFLHRFNELSRNFIWSFTDEFSSKELNEYGMTKSGLKEKCILVSINVSLIRRLCEGKLTPAEQCMAWFYTANTILHETMHGLWKQRSDTAPREPFVEDESVTELGRSFESAVFGGIPTPIHPHDQRINGWYPNIFLGIALQEWPSPIHEMYYRSEDPIYVLEQQTVLADGEVVKSYYVPTFWVSSLLAEEYWTSIVPMYGSKAFRCPKIIVSDISATQPRTYSLQTIKVEAEIDEYKPFLQQSCDAFDQREDLYRRVRPWHDKEYAIWQVSPWSWTTARLQIELFRWYHSKEKYREAMKCIYRLRAVLSLMTHLDKKLSEAKRPYSPTYWIFNIIYYLMLGSLPIQYLQETGASYIKRTCSPSQSALNAHPQKSLQQWQSLYSLPNIELLLEYSPSIPKCGPPTIKGQRVLDRCDFVDSARDLLDDWEVKGVPAPREWVVAAWHTIQDLYSQRGKVPSHAFARFDFRIPTYKPGWVTRKSGVHVDAFPDDSRFAAWTSPLVMLEAYRPSPKKGGSASRSKATSSWIASADTQEVTLYLTIAEVADNGWVVESNEDGSIDVYDIQQTFQQPEFADVEFKDVVICGTNGRQLIASDRSKLAEAIRTSMKTTVTPKGKLLKWIRSSEVAECDGRNGMPLYVTLRGHIFDVTDFPGTSKQRAVLEANPGGRLVFGERANADTISELVRSLLPYRCGLLMPVDATSSSQESLSPYTTSMLRKHDNPSNGIYMAVHGFVYDMTGYVDFHPGGFNILKKLAGRNATLGYADYHTADLLNNTDYAALKIGRLIPELTSKQVGRYQIALHGWVFDIQELVNEDRGLYEKIRQLRGLDATALLISDEPSESETANQLAQFYVRYKKWIVAKFDEDIKLPEISLDQLKEHNDPDTPEGAWVAVGNDVFDVTPMMRHRTCYEGIPQMVPTWAGKELKYDKTMAWLQNEQSHRIVASLKNTGDLGADGKSGGNGGQKRGHSYM